MSTILEAGEGKENGRPPRPPAGQRRKKRRRLNDLDSDSTVEEEESEEEFRVSERYVRKGRFLTTGRRGIRHSRPRAPSLFPPTQLGGGVRCDGKRERRRVGVQQQRQQRGRQAAKRLLAAQEAAETAAKLQKATTAEGLLG